MQTKFNIHNDHDHSNTDPFYLLIREAHGLERRIKAEIDRFRPVDPEMADSTWSSVKTNLGEVCCSLGDLSDNHGHKYRSETWCDSNGELVEAGEDYARGIDDHC